MKSETNYMNIYESVHQHASVETEPTNYLEANARTSKKCHQRERVRFFSVGLAKKICSK